MIIQMQVHIFLTLCAWQRKCLFGEILNGEMVLNGAGRIIVDEWEKIEMVGDNVMLDEFIVMPDHFHEIIFFVRHRRGDPIGSP